jgi:hypothetical protein
VKTKNDETVEFDAVAENLITIPPYTPFGFEVVEEASMYDLDCGARLQDLCEEIESLKHTDAGKLSDDAAKAKLFKTFGFNCTDVGFKP